MKSHFAKGKRLLGSHAYARITISHFDPELFRLARGKARADHQTLSSYIVKLIRAELRREAKRNRGNGDGKMGAADFDGMGIETNALTRNNGGEPCQKPKRKGR